VRTTVSGIVSNDVREAQSQGKTPARRKEATVTLLQHLQLTAIGYGKNFAVDQAGRTRGVIGLGRVLVKPPCHPGRWMSAFGVRAYAFSCCPTCPLMIQSGHSPLELISQSRLGGPGLSRSRRRLSALKRRASPLILSVRRRGKPRNWQPFTMAGNTEFNCLLWMPPNEQRAGDIVLVDSTNFTTLFGGTKCPLYP
jgi:hypothetical protein